MSEKDVQRAIQVREKPVEPTAVLPKFILDSLPDGVFALDEKYRIVFANEVVHGLLGYHATELVGQNFVGLFADPSAANEWLVATVTNLQRRRQDSGRLVLRRRDLRSVAIGYSVARPLPGADPQIALIGTLRDISGDLESNRMLTVRNRNLATLSRLTAIIAEGGELRPMLEKLLLILMQTLDLRAVALYVASKDNRQAVLTAHRGMPRALTDRHSTVSLDPPWVRRLLDRTDASRVLSTPGVDPAIVGVLREFHLEDVHCLAVRHKGRADGGLLFIPVRSLTADDQSLLEAIGAQLGVAIDNAQLIAEIRDSQTKYSTVVERANDGIMISQDGVFRFVNKRLADMLGYAVSDMIGMDITAVMWPSDRADIVRRYEARISGEVPKEVYRSRLLTRDGQVLNVEFNATLSEFDGRPASLSFVRDITRRVAMEQAILAEKQTAQFYNDVLTHDVNNFIHTILGSADLLGDPTIAATEEDRQRYLKTLRKTARRCADLIDQVRELMSIQRLEPSSFVPVPLRPAIQEAVDIVRDQMRNIPFEARVSAADNQFVLGNQLLRQIFINLVSNAVRHNSKTEKWVEITVESCAGGGGWRISVADNGDGVPAEARARLYERFARFSKSEGLGLGMSIVKALVDVMSGEIQIEDRVIGQPHEGTRFVITFPRA